MVFVGEPLLKFLKFLVPMNCPKPVEGSSDPQTQDVEFPIILPHAAFSFLYNECPEIFSDMFLAGKDR